MRKVQIVPGRRFKVFAGNNVVGEIVVIGDDEVIIHAFALRAAMEKYPDGNRIIAGEKVFVVTGEMEETA